MRARGRGPAFASLGVRFLRRGAFGSVPLRRREVELTVERPLGPGGDGTVARLTARFDAGPGEADPTPAELAAAFERLRSELDALVGPSLAALPIPRTDRSLEELVGAYRPRQRELIDLLRDEGEISSVEHARLAEYLGTGEAARPVAVRTPEPVLPPAPIAAVPLAAVPADAGRPVPELLRTYQISNLKQAGAVRARRQISFGEYMALKRHFEQDGRVDGGPDVARR